MKQHHYLFDSLDDLQRACCDLEDMGVPCERLHVAHNNHLSLEKRHLNGIGEVGETDLVHSGLRGLMFGVFASVLTGSVAWLMIGGHELGGVITVFVTLMALGFCTWVGGLVGASHDNWRLSPYHDQLVKGKSLLLVDLPLEQEPEVTRFMAALHSEGHHTGESSSHESPLEGRWNLELRETREVA